MLVLHGFWSTEKGLCLWAEDSERTVTSPSQAFRSARPHPFAAPASLLSGIHSGKAAEAALLLPSLRKSPLDSPELVRVAPRPAAKLAPGLLSWTVPVVVLDATSALTALDEHHEDVRVGASVRYLAEIAAFANELVTRGRVLPAVVRSEPAPAARWRPVLQGHDVAAVHKLATAMPPVCRAESGGESPYRLITDALHTLVDAAVRVRLPTGMTLAPTRRGRRPKHPPVVEKWLDALTSPDGRFDADLADLDELSHALAPWEEVGAGQTGPARAMFRLREVIGEHEESLWRLDFLLQSMDDPSLLIPAEQAWNDDGGLRRWLDRPQELLLAELGRASRVYPELAPGLRQSRPTDLGLDADGAYRFLSVAAPALDEAGFGVMVPSWWDKRAKLGLTMSASTPVDGVVGKKGKFGRDQLVKFRWQLAIGDDTLTDEEIAALAATKALPAATRLPRARRGAIGLSQRESTTVVIGELAAALSGVPAVRLFNTALVVKEPRARWQYAQVGWHCDRTYWPTCASEDMITASIPLQDTTVDMGTLSVIDHSHSWPDSVKRTALRETRSFMTTDNDALRHRLQDLEQPLDTIVIELKKGHLLRRRD